MPANHPHLPSALEPAGCARRCTSLYGFSDRECHPLAKDPHLSLPAQGPARPRGLAIGLELDCLHLRHPNSNQCGSSGTSNPPDKTSLGLYPRSPGGFSQWSIVASHPCHPIWQKPFLQPHRYSNRCALARRCDHLVGLNLDHLPNLRTQLANWIWCSKSPCPQPFRPLFSLGREGMSLVPAHLLPQVLPDAISQASRPSCLNLVILIPSASHATASA